MIAPIAHGGGIAAAAALFGGRPEYWLDLSTGINPCPPALPEIAPSAWQRLPDRHLAETARATRHTPAGPTQRVISAMPRWWTAWRSSRCSRTWWRTP